MTRGERDRPPTRPLRVTDLARFEYPESPTISPDGTSVGYVLRTIDLEQDRYVRQLWELPAEGGDPRRLTEGPDDSAPTFSPDGRHLAFVREVDGKGQLFLLPVAGGEAQRLTTLPLGAGVPRWSPDGSRLAFVAPVDIAAGATEASAAAKSDRAPIVADRIDYLADGAGAFGTMRSHVHVLEVAARTVRQVTRGDWHAGDPAWSPDGARLAFVAARSAGSDLSSDVGAYVVSVEGADEPVRVGPAPATLAAVIWGNDEQTILAVGSAEAPNDPPALLRLRDDKVSSLSEPLDRTVLIGGPAYPGGLPQLRSDANSVVFCARDAGRTRLYRTGLDDGEVVAIETGVDTVVAGLAIATRAARAAIVLAGPESFGDIAIVDLERGSCSVRTEHGKHSLDGLALFPRTERQFAISDGTTITGWLTRDETRNGPGPLLLDIHGGPHNAWNAAADDVHLYHQVLAARGWAVLTVNSRGSDGYGAAFYGALDGAWGVADRADFLEPLDELVAEGVADPSRLAVTGYSYGGFATCFLTSCDNRFAAAVAGGVVSDLTSLAGTSDAGHFIARFELGGTPDELPERYVALSPINAVADVTTPTLVLHGKADERCPVGQAQQWFTALRAHDVPTRLVLYPEASHLFPVTGRPTHRIDYNERVVDWLELYAGAGPTLRERSWQQRLADAADRYGVPGAVFGIVRLREGSVESAAATFGVLNTETGVPVTADSVFQIGSISKPWTATLIMQLVDEGRLELDAPVRDVLPELQRIDERALTELTVRHLLTHTSGIDGDIFTDTGDGDDALECYVALLADAAQLFAVGATYSYSNAGYAILGRIVEVLTGQTFEDALRERLAEPLGLRHTALSPAEAIRFRVAAGHVGADDALRLADSWALPRATRAGGGVIASIDDLLAFATLHLRGGRTPDGRQLLSAASTAAMAACHAELPMPLGTARSWGLGWGRHDWDGTTLIGHDGATIGQSAFLLLSPEHGLAVGLLTNAADAGDLCRELFRAALAELADLSMPASPEPPEPPVSMVTDQHVGRYERAGMSFDVTVEDGRLMMCAELTGALADLLPDKPQPVQLVARDRDRYLYREPGDRRWTPVNFLTLPDGSHYLYSGRLTPKVR